MSGVGSDKPTFQALMNAFEAHAKEIYGEDYMLQDFVMIGYVVTMEPDDDRAEYLLATSSKADHIIAGLVHQVDLFQSDEPED